MVTGLGISVAIVLVPHTLYNFQAAAYPETVWCPNDNGVVPHLAGRVNGQGSPSAGAVTTFPLCLGHRAGNSMFCKEEGIVQLIVGKCTEHIRLLRFTCKLHTALKILIPPDRHILFIYDSIMWNATSSLKMIFQTSCLVFFQMSDKSSHMRPLFSFSLFHSDHNRCQLVRLELRSVIQGCGCWDSKLSAGSLGWLVWTSNDSLIQSTWQPLGGGWPELMLLQAQPLFRRLSYKECDWLLIRHILPQMLFRIGTKL